MVAAKPAPKARSVSSAQETKTDPGANALIEQGKTFYRSGKFKQALAKFEAALKLEPKNDEALGLAAVTAFRLDNQVQSRDYFLRRAELPNQKDSVKAFCFYRASLTYWRDAHDIVGRYGNVENGKLVYDLPERAASDASYNITNGLEYVERALAITNDFPEAYNIKNLLHAEAALAERDERKEKEHRNQALKALRRAIEISDKSADGKRGDAADFSQPTIRIAEFASTAEEDVAQADPMMKMITGGKPKKRVQPAFPSIRLSKPSIELKDPSTKGAISEGGISVPEAVKVEVLISTTGDVVFAHIIEGRPGLNDAAILASRGWKFEPAKFEDKPVQVSSVISFEIKPKR